MDDYIIFDDYTVDDFSKYNLMITVEPIVEEYDDEDREHIFQECGTAISSSIRTRDFIVQEGNHFYLSLSELNNQNELEVVDRLRRRLVDAGMYFLANTVIDARIKGEDMKYKTWYKVAV
ncbi:MAG: hypothetical protein K5865_10600 [Eubacterium sp.]|nr:hypothetical protein [Eubacterium sp.]